MIGFFAKLVARTAELAVSQSQQQPKKSTVKIESTDNYRIDDNSTLGRYWGTDSEKFAVPDGIQKLGSFSFDGHKELTEIEIPPSVKEVGYHTFYNCPNLMKIKVSPFNPYLCDVDGILYDKSKKTLLCCPAGRESICIPSTVTSIKYENAFADSQHLTEISVDKLNSKYTVVKGVLYENSPFTLTKLVRCPVDRVVLDIPQNITEICNHAFENCIYLAEIDIPERVSIIGGYAFKNCHSLERVKFPKSLKKIGDSGFRICKSLKEVILPEGTETIIAGTFNECASLETLIIPDSVHFVGYITYDCPNLKKVICHEISFRQNWINNRNQILYMIVNRKFDEKVEPEIKYEILYQLHQKHPDDMKIEHTINSTFVQIIKDLTTAQNMDWLEKYVSTFPQRITDKNIDEMISHAIDTQAYEIQIFLTNYKYEHFDFQEPDWKL